MAKTGRTNVPAEFLPGAFIISLAAFGLGAVAGPLRLDLPVRHRPPQQERRPMPPAGHETITPVTTA